MAYSKVTKTNFNAVLKSIHTSGLNVTENVQLAVMFALDAFAQTGNPAQLTSLLRTTIATKGVNADKLRVFITAHANVRWDRKASCMKKTGKKGDAAKVDVPSTTWTEYAKPKTAAKSKVLHLSKLRERMVKISESGLGVADMESQAGASLIAAFMESKEFKNGVKKRVAERKAQVTESNAKKSK